MTCIAALVQNNIVYMGGDSAGIGNLDLTVRADPKVFINRHVIIGFTGSFRFGQVMHYHFEPPTPNPLESDMQYMVRRFIPAMRDILKEHGSARVDNNQEQGGLCLVGHSGQLYCIDYDYQVGEPLDNFAAIGCGAQIAHGALFATRRVKDPWKRLATALEASERFSAGVRGPFIYEATL